MYSFCVDTQKYLFININQLDALNFIISLFQASTCFEHMRSSSGGQNHTYRCDDTRDCIIQFCPPDDERMCLKHVEAWNKLIIKFSASSWLTLINKYIEMHGQQNIKKHKSISMSSSDVLFGQMMDKHQYWLVNGCHTWPWFWFK